MASGKLISDDITYRIVRERTSKADVAGTYVLDGYPRTAIQAEQLEGLAKEQGKEIQAIEIDVPREELFKRLTGRRKCPVCNEIYNIYSQAPKADGRCDIHPDVELEQRADDSEKSVEIRLQTYDSETKPLLEYYQKSGRLRTLNGTGDVEDIYCQIEKLV